MNEIYTAGQGSDGKLGQGNTTDSPTFSKVNLDQAGGVNIVVSGSYNTCIVQNDGNILFCGLSKSPKDGSSVCGIPSSTLPPTTIPPPPSSNLALLPPKHHHHHHSTKQQTTTNNESSSTTAMPAQNTSSIPITSSLITTNAAESNPQQSHQILNPTSMDISLLPNLNGARVLQIALGNYHALLLTDTGRVFSWGSSRYGQLGRGSLLSTDYPEIIGGLSCVKQISCGTTYSIAITDFGEIFSWGENSLYQLGHGDTLNRLSPTRIIQLGNKIISKVSCGTSHVVCLSSENSSSEMFSWGQCTKDGQVCYLPSPVNISDIVIPPVMVSKIACGGWHTIIVLNTGLVLEWQLGEDFKPIANELSLNSIRDVSCGNFHSVVLSDSGLAFSWGRNNCMQLGRPNVKGSDSTPSKVEGLPEPTTANAFLASKVSAGEFHTAILVDNSKRFSAVLNLLGLIREHFRKLCVIVRGYYLPIMEKRSEQIQLSNQQSQAALIKKKKGWSFTMKKAAETKPLEATSLEAGSRSSVRIMQPISPTRNRSQTTVTTPTSSSSSSITTTTTSSIEEPQRIDKTGRRLSTGKRPSSPSISSNSLQSISPRIGNSSSNLLQQQDEGFISEDEICLLFEGIEEMLCSTSKILWDLDNKVDQWTDNWTIISDVFLSESVMKTFRKYIDWSDGYIESQMTLFGIKKRSQIFSEFLHELEATSKTVVLPMVHGETDLKSLLITPVQFVAQLFVSIRDISEKTPKDHPDSHGINSLLDKLDLLLQRVNQNFQFVDNLEILRCSADETGNPQLMGGTLKMLIERLTHLNISDPHFQDIFLLTSHTFCTPLQLLQGLIDRYFALKQSPWQARQRVFLVLAAWVNNCWDLLCLNPENVLDKLVQFLSTSNFVDEEAKRHARHIKDLITMHQQQPNQPPQQAKKQITTSQNLANGNINSVLNYSAEVIAQCIAVQDHALFRSINIKELFGKGWEKKGKEAEEKCPNVYNFTKRFNRLCEWVEKTITASTTTTKTKQGIGSCLIDITNQLHKLKDINGFVAFVYGMLKVEEKFKSCLTKEQITQFESWESLVSPQRNFKKLRQYILDIRPPCVPFFGLVLKDLTFIEDGNPNYLNSPNNSSAETEPIINFFKRRKVAEVVLKIRQQQQVQFSETDTAFESALWNACLSI